MPPVEGKYSDDERDPDKVVRDLKIEAAQRTDFNKAVELHRFQKQEGTPPRAARDQGEPPRENEEDTVWRTGEGSEQE